MDLTPESFMAMLLLICNDDDNDDKDEEKEFNGMRFLGFSKNYERVRAHCHYTGIYKRGALSICNFR